MTNQANAATITLLRISDDAKQFGNLIERTMARDARLLNDDALIEQLDTVQLALNTIREMANKKAKVSLAHT